MTGGRLGKLFARAVSGLFILIGYNGITMLGASLILVSVITIGFLVVLGELGGIQGAYLGILTFLILPGVFILGLFLISFGALVEYGRRRRSGKSMTEARQGPAYPVLDFNHSRTRDVFLATAGLTAVSLILVSGMSFQGVKFSNTSEFCGLVCHSIMEPEYTSYLNSPHARVECVKCHIGPGATWFARSKISGVGQVFAAVSDEYSRPIPHPIRHLRPSRLTCEQCHSPTKSIEDRLRVIPKYLNDKENSLVYSILLMRLGVGGRVHGFHVGDESVTTYYSEDAQRQKIDFVRVTSKDGSIKEYTSSDTEKTIGDTDPAKWRTMDCIDCHNRAAHGFTTAAKAMDALMNGREVDLSLPFLKKIGVDAMQEQGEVQGNAEAVGEAVRGYYRENYQDLFKANRNRVEQAVKAIQAAYVANVFPKMKVTWGTYPNNIGHTDSLGCFRCHDESHETKNGEVISQDCSICHTILAWDEEDPEILEQLGI